LFRVKNGNLFAKFFRRKHLKNHNIGPWSPWFQSFIVAKVERGKPKRGIHKFVFSVSPHFICENVTIRSAEKEKKIISSKNWLKKLAPKKWQVYYIFLVSYFYLKNKVALAAWSST
jgi:hypothetical protein